jgi:hypothetical protein
MGFHVLSKRIAHLGSFRPLLYALGMFILKRPPSFTQSVELRQPEPIVAQVLDH